jgi:hypothetical protein
MSKFIHTGNRGRNVVAQEGVVPETLTPKPPASSAAPQAVAPATPAKPNYFQLAGLDATGNGYTGTAEQNEKLRRALDPSNKARTFYDAYKAKFNNTWHQHPSQRIDNLRGYTAPQQGQPGSTPQQGQVPGAQAPVTPQPGTTFQQGQVPQQGQPGTTFQQGQAAVPPLPPGFTKSQSGILIPPLPR